MATVYPAGSRYIMVLDSLRRNAVLDPTLTDGSLAVIEIVLFKMQSVLAT